MALQLDTFDKKEQLVTKYMALMKNSFKESYFSENACGMITTANLQYEQMQCQQSLQNNISYIASSQINDVFTYSNINPNEIDPQTYKQVEKLYLHKKIDMLQEIIHTIDTKKDFHSSISHAPVIQSSITFKELYELFLKEKQRQAPNTAQTTWKDYQSAYNDFIYVIENAENRDISTFAKKDFHIFVEALHNQLPTSRNKKAKYRNLSFNELKKITLYENEKQAHNTKQKKMSAIQQMFDIAIDPRYEYLEKNEAKAFLIKPIKKGHEENEDKRKPLIEENLIKLFSSKNFTNEHIKIFNPEKYWIPIIAIYTGMRQNEICQLHIDDLQSEVIEIDKKFETVWCFDINRKGTKHLKTKNSKRLVPIHPDLIELGFIDYFNNVKEKQDRFWSNLRFHPKEERYNTDYNKSFMRYFRRHVTTNPLQVFHSMRHNVGDQLIKNTVRHKLPKDLVNQLIGHEPDKDMTSRVYSQGYGIKELFQAIRTLDFHQVKSLLQKK